MRVLVTLSGFNLTAKPSATETLVIPFSDIWQVSFNLTAKPSATETPKAAFLLTRLNGFNLTAKPSATETIPDLLLEKRHQASILLLSLRLLKPAALPETQKTRESFNLTAKPSATETSLRLRKSFCFSQASILLLSLRLLKLFLTLPQTDTYVFPSFNLTAKPSATETF